MSRQTLKYSEIFYSIQGEGRFAGVPSVFLRTFGCNFTCQGFGQPRDRSQWVKPSKMLHNTEDLSQATSLSDLDVPEIGCDSSASWGPRYAHLATAKPYPEVARAVAEASPYPGWESPAGEAIHLVITGGEPLLKGWQRAYPRLLAEAPLKGLRHLTFETNGTQALTPDFTQALEADGRPYHLNFSISPKLSRSGEKREDALRPEVIKAYGEVPDSHIGLKFVVEDRADVNEAIEVCTELRQAGCPIDGIYLMPMAASGPRYAEVAPKIAELAMEYGLRYSPRLQIDLFRNRYGT